MPNDPRVSMPGRATGRRSGRSGTREAILASARAHFAHDGYSASLRAIATTAGVDVALIRHFFGGKDDLFAAILDIPDGTGEALVEALAGDPRHRGERLVRAYLGLWEDPAIAEPLLAIARTALASRSTTERLRTLITQRLLNPNLEAAVGDEGKTRVALVSAQLMGIALARYVIRAGPLADMDIDTLAASAGPGIQQQLVSAWDRG